jgi:hypothetical protein
MNLLHVTHGVPAGLLTGLTGVLGGAGGLFTGEGRRVIA